MESDATSPSLKRSVLFQVISSVTQGDDQVTEQDAYNDEDQGHAMGNVRESIAVGRTQRNPRKPIWLTTNKIVAYALPVLRRQSRLHTGKLKSVQSPRCERMP